MESVRIVAAGAVAAFLFWASVQWLSSVMLGLAGLAAWFAAIVALPMSILPASTRLRNFGLLLLSITIGCGLLELLLRTDLVTRLVQGAAFEARDGLTSSIAPPFFAEDRELGIRILPDRRSRWIHVRHGEVLFDATMTSDARGFRKLPLGPAGGEPVLFIGDSFNFGTGVNDDQTSAFYLRELSKGALQPVNASVSGYGVHQVLRQLELGRPYLSGHRRFGWAFLSVVDDHVLRAAGRSYWPQHSPRYRLQSDGMLLHDGVFPSNTGADPSSFLHKLLVGSRLFALAWKAMATDQVRDERLFVALLREIRTTLSADYGARLIVLYFSGNTWRGELAGAREMMIPLLCKAGVEFIDVNSSLPGQVDDPGRFYIRGDGHPTAELNRLVATLLNARVRGTGPAPRPLCDTASQGPSPGR